MPDLVSKKIFYYNCQATLDNLRLDIENTYSSLAENYNLSERNVKNFTRELTKRNS